MITLLLELSVWFQGACSPAPMQTSGKEPLLGRSYLLGRPWVAVEACPTPDLGDMVGTVLRPLTDIFIGCAFAPPLWAGAKSYSLGYV